MSKRRKLTWTLTHYSITVYLCLFLFPFGSHDSTYCSTSECSGSTMMSPRGSQARPWGSPLCVSWRRVPHFRVTGMHWLKSWARSHKQGRAHRVPLGLQREQLLGAAAGAHCVPGASLSAGCLHAFFLFVFLRFGSGSCPLAAPAFSGCVPPAAKWKSRISSAHWEQKQRHPTPL